MFLFPGGHEYKVGREFADEDDPGKADDAFNERDDWNNSGESVCYVDPCF